MNQLLAEYRFEALAEYGFEAFVEKPSDLYYADTMGYPGCPVAHTFFERDEYNAQQPHSSLGYEAPAGFAPAFAATPATPAAHAGSLGQPCS